MNDGPKYSTKRQRAEGVDEASTAFGRVMGAWTEAMAVEHTPASTKRDRVLAWGRLRSAIDTLALVTSDMTDM
jgi:hypothetical protein